MAPDATPPPAPALGADHQWLREFAAGPRDGALTRDIRALLAAYDAQAARLATVDTRLHSRIAECCGAQLGQRSCESFGCPDLQEIRDMLATSAAGETRSADAP